MSKRTHRVFELSLLSCLAGITFACFAFFPAVAGVGAWTSNGPELGHVRDVAIDPSAPQNVYAATVGGLFKSVDGGSSWSRVFITTPNQISLTVFYAVAVSPSGRVYVGTQYYDSLWWSDDGGQNWFPGSGLPDHNPPWTIVVDPTAPHTTLFGATPGPGVYRSDDGGMNWVQAMGTAPNALPFGVTTDLTFDGSTIYACGANNRGVWKSTDLGANWYPVGAGLPTQSVRAMALDPTGNLYVATHQQG
ncbi:MAG: hypothetical protein OES25_16415, partial [Acidobacteriota bacterium]|nr:hypothetical protein [Acidobacteriota bacterium]